MCDGHHTLPLETERQSLIYKCNKVSVEKVSPSKMHETCITVVRQKIYEPTSAVKFRSY